MTVSSPRPSLPPALCLGLFCLAVVLLPALVLRPRHTRIPFDSAPLDQLRESQPKYVFLGDSMLDSRIDGPYLSELLDGAPVSVLAPGGSATARWYLALKNYVIPSGARPQVVFLFFRDRYFSLPRFRTEGRYRPELEASMQADEPVARRLIDGSRTPRAGMASLMEWAYPLLGLRVTVREDLHRLAAKLASSRAERDGLMERANASFSLPNLRADLPSEWLPHEEELSTPFDPDPNASFLPHLLELAGRSGLRLCLVRVKRRPNHGNVRTQDPELRGYVAALKQYVEGRGHYFYDETDDATLTLSTYQDGDHLSEAARRPYTQGFRRRLAPVFQ